MKRSARFYIRIAGSTCGAAVLAYAVLLIPLPGDKPFTPAHGKPFLWSQDQYWSALESRFVACKSTGCDSLKHSILSGLKDCRTRIAELSAAPHQADDTLFRVLEQRIFSLGPMIGACPSELHAYIDVVVQLRSAIKDQSVQWDVSSLPVRDRLYRLLYGSRQAIEEVMLQASPVQVPSSITCYDGDSKGFASEILGMRVFSGDILVSRGAVPTSALIARGNDYPGNFSHVALVHVDSTGRVSLIESHIEKGVSVSGVSDYLRDRKLRIMILRFRADLPPVTADPMIPSKAADAALADSRSRHIAYDFGMDFDDTSKYFCSEVVSTAYRRFGIRLWKGMSSISTPGTSRWLAAFGVRHFETEEPSDLEYDPQLRVVAEWRDPRLLFDDHVDNSVIDAMLEDAERGEELGYNWYLLPIARVLKLYSLVLNAFGSVGPVPEGMEPKAALYSRWVTSTHAGIKEMVLRKSEQFRQERGYNPPYWELLAMAREAKGVVDPH